MPDTSEPVVVNRPDGTSLTFKRCSPTDWFRFRAAFRAYRKAWLGQTLQILGIVGREAVAYMNELDARPLRDGEAVKWLNEPEGMREAVLLSLRIDSPAATLADVDALKLESGELLAAAAGVFSLSLVPVAPAPPEGGQGGPLPEGPSSGPTATGQGTQTASDAGSVSAATTP